MDLPEQSKVPAHMRHLFEMMNSEDVQKMLRGPNPFRQPSPPDLKGDEARRFRERIETAKPAPADTEKARQMLDEFEKIQSQNR